MDANDISSDQSTLTTLPYMIVHDNSDEPKELWWDTAVNVGAFAHAAAAKAAADEMAHVTKETADKDRKQMRT
eukprot:3043608-Heterocapsa_arctica.AAC.1